MSVVGPLQTTPAARAARPRWVIAVVALYLLLQSLLVASNVRGMFEPSAGFIYYVHLSGELEAHAVTEPGVRALGGAPSAFVRAVNGHALEGRAIEQAAVYAMLDQSPGAANHFVLQPKRGALVDVHVPVAMPGIRYLFQGSIEPILFPLVGCLYLALGLWVWWKRPSDRAATPMLLFTLVTANITQLNLGFDALARALSVVERATFPFYAPSLIYFGLSFTGFHRQRQLRRTLWASLVLALALSGYERAFAWPDPERLVIAQALTGALLASSVSLVVVLGLLAARSHHPVALQRRGRLLAKACALAFLLPSLCLMLPDLPGTDTAVGVLLGTFPVAIAYSIVRHGVFDFRIALRQGLLYALLSIGVLLGYLGLSFTAFRIAGETARTPVFAAVMGAAVVVALSLLQLRVQGAINRFVFRSRYLFNEAIAQASARLARARSTEAVTEAVRAALIGKLELSRAALAIASQDGRVMHCVTLSEGSEHPAERPPLSLPNQLTVARLEPVRRALERQGIVTAYDSAAASAQVALDVRSPECCIERDCDPASLCCDEGTFWTQFGLEAVVPLTVGAGARDARVVGVLLLGPKLNGKPLDSADEHLVFTLANQLAVALENTAAFEEIRALKEGLEQQVQTRTRALTNALRDLERAQVQLVESEKQAMLGRLVAGMAHEANTPLGTLRSSIDTLERLLSSYRELARSPSLRDEPRAQRLLRSDHSVDQLLGVMTGSAERLSQLVTTLKGFVSLDQASRQRLDVRESIDSALSVLSSSLKPEIEIKQSYQDPDLVVSGDRAKLNQLFWNLLQNALTAVGDRGEIRIEARRVDGCVRIDLSDNGVGIPGDRLAEVFDFGFTRKNGRMGLRLGLPTSKLTVEELGGDISITSVPGQGTSVRLSLPA